MEIKIKCPTCGKILRLNDAPNINASTFTCPVCKDKHRVGDCQRYEPLPSTPSDETQIGGARQSSGGDETMVGRPKGGDETQVSHSPKPQAAGSLIDAVGRAYPLHHGVNTIGRRAATSPATVQIDTADRYMSRSHAVITVQQTATKTLHVLKNGANKNPSYLNGTLIGVTDQLILNNGDRLTLGKTTLTFKL